MVYQTLRWAHHSSHRDIVHRYTKVLQRPDLVTVDKDGNSHPLLSNEAVARVFKRLADRLQGVVSDTSTITITPEYNFGRPQPRIGGLSVAKTEGVRRQSRSETSRRAAEARKARKRAVDQIWQTYTWYLPVICTSPVNRAFRGYMTCLPHWHLYVHAGAKLWW